MRGQALLLVLVAGCLMAQQFPATSPIDPAIQKTPEVLSTAEVQQQIRLHLLSEPGLADAKVKAKAGKTRVVLSGYAQSELQRGLALKIAKSYAGSRQIVDKIKVRQGQPSEPIATIRRSVSLPSQCQG